MLRHCFTIKPFHKPLPDNYTLSRHRLSTLKTKLDKNEELKQEYNQVFDNYSKGGIIQTFADNDYGVLKKRSTCRMRLLFGVIRRPQRYVQYLTRRQKMEMNLHLTIAFMLDLVY